jgi:hypothetical protein
MARIVTSTYRYKRPPRTVALAAVVVAAALLAGCATDGRPSGQDLALRGYWYHDANHQGLDLTARTQLVERDLEKPGYSH